MSGLILVSPGGLSGGGGMGSVTRAMAGWLADNRADIAVSVVDPRGGGAGFWWPFHLARAMAQVIGLGLTRRAQVMHVQVSQRASFVRKGLLVQLGRLLGMRVVLHHHGSEFAAFYEAASPGMRCWVRRVTGQADVNVVLGRRARDFLVDRVGVDPQSISVIPNASPDILGGGELGSQRNPWDLLIAANLSPRKGIDTLLKAVAQLALAGAPVQLTLAGGGEIERYRKEAEALGIAGRCRFTGWIGAEAIRQAYLSHGVLVLPSHDEGLPMAILEALSAGLAVITTPVGAIPEVLEHEQTCLFVPPGDANALARAIARLSQDAALRQSLIDKARRLYEDGFAIGPYMDKMLRLYEAPAEGP